MGCDIHVLVECKNHKGDWVNENNFKWDWIDKEFEMSDHFSRNYELFNRLAGVRGTGENMIVENLRGVPDDMCKVSQGIYKRWEPDAHSATHFGLRELWKAQENDPKIVKRSGMVSPDAARKLDTGEGAPTMWCQYTSLDDWVYREWTEDCDVLDGFIKQVEDIFRFNRRENYRERLLEDDRVDNYRVVVWFDN